MMSKVIAIAVLIRGIDLFRIFDYVKVMTEFGAGHRHRNAHLLCRPNLFQRRLSLCLDLVDDHPHPGHRRLDPVHEDFPGEALMEQSFPHRTLRDIAAVLVVAIFMFPLFWWALTSIKPMYAIFNKDEVVVFDFVPTLINYAVVLLGWSRSEIAIESGSTFGVGGTSSYDSRQTILDSIIVSVGSTALTMVDRGACRLCPVAHGVQEPQRLPELGARPALHAADRHHRAAGADVQSRRHARHRQSLHGLCRPHPHLCPDEPADRRAADEVLLRRRAEGCRRGGDDRRRHALADFPRASCCRW